MRSVVFSIIAAVAMLISASAYAADSAQKIWMMQINPTVGDIEHNLGLIEDQYRKAVASGADVVMTPEMALVGYPPRDLLRNREMMPRVNAALARLQKLTETLRTPDGRKVALVVGHPGETRTKKGKEIQNRTTVFEDGKVIEEHNKRLLPTYDVFDEKRYFEEGKGTKSFEINGVKYAILNCEEGWYKDPQFGRIIYQKDPAADIKKLVDQAHAEGKKLVILDTSASPWYYGKQSTRKEIHSDVVSRTGADGLVYTNMWGGNDQILFDGHSFVMRKDGKLLGQMDAFKDGHGVVAVPKALGDPIKILNRSAFTTAAEPEDKVLYDGLVTGIRDYYRKTGLKGAVIGLSGGKDSAVVAQLYVDALGSENVIGVSMPSSISSDGSKSEAKQLAEKLHIQYIVHPISCRGYKMISDFDT